MLTEECASLGPLSRAELARRTGLTKATVSGLVESLVECGIVVEHDAPRGSVGRPANPIALNPLGPVGLGVEINVDYVVACVVDLTGAVRLRRVLEGDNRTVSPQRTLRKVGAVVNQLWTAAEGGGLDVAGVGVAVPGAVADGTVLRTAPNLPEWNGLAVGKALSSRVEQLGGSPHVDNEANLAAMAERWYGVATSLPDFVYVSGEVGVGAGVVLGGRLFRGLHGFAGEIGHVLVDSNGAACSCGNYGCLEEAAGQEALLRASGITRAAVGSFDGSARGVVSAFPIHEAVTAELVTRARAGDPPVIAAIRDAGSALGTALSNLVNILDIPVIVLGGLYAHLFPWLEDPINAQLGRRVVSGSWDRSHLLTSSLGFDAAARGAAGLVVKEILDDPAAWVDAAARQARRGASAHRPPKGVRGTERP